MRLSIGQLSKHTHESVKTLRYWADLGLLEAERGDNGYRYFQSSMLDRVHFIRSSQALGFSLNEIKRILDLQQNGVPPCDHVRHDLRKHLENVKVRMAELKQLECELSERLEWAEAHPAPFCNAEGCVYLTQK